jgi:hypothetical protein
MVLHVKLYVHVEIHVRSGAPNTWVHCSLDRLKRICVSDLVNPLNDRANDAPRSN